MGTDMKFWVLFVKGLRGQVEVSPGRAPGSARYEGAASLPTLRDQDGGRSAQRGDGAAPNEGEGGAKRVPATRAARRIKRRSCPSAPVRTPIALAPRLLAPRIRSPKMVGPTGNAPVSVAYQAAALLLSYGPMADGAWQREDGAAPNGK